MVSSNASDSLHTRTVILEHISIVTDSRVQIIETLQGREGEGGGRERGRGRERGGGGGGVRERGKGERGRGKGEVSRTE